MSNWSPNGTEDGKKEGELFLTQVIELAQHNGARFVCINGSWQLWDQDSKQIVLYSVASWVCLSEAALAYCKANSIPLTVTRLEEDRIYARSTPISRKFADPETLRKKYEE